MIASSVLAVFWRNCTHSMIGHCDYEALKLSLNTNQDLSWVNSSEKLELLVMSWCMQVLTSDFSARTASAVMNRLAKLSARFIGENGFSIGIDDVTPAHELQVNSHRYITNTSCLVDLFNVVLMWNSLYRTPQLNKLKKAKQSVGMHDYSITRTCASYYSRSLFCLCLPLELPSTQSLQWKDNRANLTKADCAKQWQLP